MTAGEGNTEIGIRIVRPVPVDVDTIRLEVANIDEVAIGVPAFLYVFPSMQRLRIINQ